ncbi:MAG: A/G-specific adenine glycosylase [Deltaproteobacteria bacterium]|nr:A/G-specific adenine glycosylase [Deltaproteobacteria bacterium]
MTAFTVGRVCYIRGVNAKASLTAKDVEKLLRWYDANHRKFPWRENPEAYHVWLAEVMSQQTQMAALLPYFYGFLEKFPSVGALASSDESEVLAAWAGLGYYSRARNLRKAARAVARAGARFPRTLEGWRALPGVGPYTAAAIASQVLGVAEPVWDGNVLRVCARVFAEKNARSSAFREKSLGVLREFIREENASRFNQSLMELGAAVCTPKNPRCARCPLENACLAKRGGNVAAYPAPKPRTAVRDVRARALVQLRPRGGEFDVYLVERRKGSWFSGLWDFPSDLGGVREPVIACPNATKGFRKFVSVRHSITHHRIELEGWMRIGGRGVPKEGKWISLDALTEESPPLALATTAKKLLRPLLQALQKVQKVAAN